MATIDMIQTRNASASVREILDGVEESQGLVPNLVRTLAHSPAALRGFLALGSALEEGALTPQMRERVALTVSEANKCSYCVAAHYALGRSVGLSDLELQDARQATSPDRHVEALLWLARQLVEQRGHLDGETIGKIREAGVTDAEIAEVVAIVAWTTFANYFNQVAGTEIDFPPAPLLAGDPT